MFNCLSPFSKRDELTNENMDFPCGKCYPCLRRRVSGWSFRLRKEGEQCSSSYFITLTYNTNYVPITNNGFMGLSGVHPTLFFKRLRKYHENNRGNYGSIKYFMAAEYGGKTNRPHYHAIIFNARIEDIEKAWIYGAIHCGEVTDASIGYTLKYMMKKGKIPMHKNDDRLPEFQRMSKGLGKSYLTDNIRLWHKSDLENRMYIPDKDGKKWAMPRYYKDKLYTDVEKRQIGAYLKLLKEEIDLTGVQEINRYLYYEQRKNRSRLVDVL